MNADSETTNAAAGPLAKGLWENAARARSIPDAIAPGDVSRLVEAILAAALDAGASDVHLVPGDAGLAMLWRIDGVLHPTALFPRDVRANVVSRLKVLADLLTYQTDVPQEGRIRQAVGEVEVRVSTFPTLFGEKAVVRLFVGSQRFRALGDLGLPDEIGATLQRLLDERGGVLLITGPAGSGKTTTAYVCLREILRNTAALRSVATLEDPVETLVEGTAQSQIRPVSGFTYDAGMKSLLRQDPDVILVGEIRDPPTAQAVFQAALTGHLILSTFHTGSAAESIGRLLDMGIEPYQLRGAVLAVLNQRLLRRLCPCARPAEREAELLGLRAARASLPVGCPECGGTGFRGRMLLVELLRIATPAFAAAILRRADFHELERLAAADGMATRWDQACEAVAAGLTSPDEVRRVLGFRQTSGPDRP